MSVQKMRWGTYIPFVFGCGLASLLVSCVSIQLPKNKESTHQAQIKVSSPAEPFARWLVPEVEKAWRNPKNGNLISVNSECGFVQEPTFTDLITHLRREMDNTTIATKDDILFQGRRALSVVLEGDLDGYASQLTAVIAKFDGCILTATFFGLKEKKKEDQNTFEVFWKEIQLP